MGRRSAKIAGRKGTQDARKAKIYSRICKTIIREAKAGGPDPVANVKLAAAMQQAKNAGVPKDAVTRNIAKASDKSQADFTEVTYEAYGAGGSGFIIDCLTDNPNRSAMEVRTVVTRSGAKMADPGSVAFGFKRCGVVAIAGGADEEEVFDAAMEAGADDIQTVDPDEQEEGEASISFKVVSDAKEFGALRSALSEAGLEVDDSHSGLVYLPHAETELNEKELQSNQSLYEKLLALDDVDNVFSSCATHD
ncbi:hypothetical protein WJX73_002980 [Symbiochloris irregularis]|uniref:Transcriptional regulatory protein n=1 Tax=Symbiochloris irregularis TaxID=706552 RepID=A0AAW1NR96_9CHLO